MLTWDRLTVASLAIFVATYVLISVRRIPALNLDRPSAAMVGGTLMVLLGIVPFGDALHREINWETICPRPRARVFSGGVVMASSTCSSVTTRRIAPACSRP